MLNSTCQFSIPSHVAITHYFSYFLSFIVYTLAFWTLLFKCPSHIRKYRDYLVVHIISGVILEIHMGNVVGAFLHIPWACICCNGLLAQYCPILFQFFIYFLVFTGYSAIALFGYRMNAATQHASHSKLYRMAILFKYAFIVSSAVLFVVTVLIYPDLKYQREYKVKKEQEIGTFLAHMWCDNCYFMNFDSMLFALFYCCSYTTVVLGFFAGFTPAAETVRALNSPNLRLSARTVAIQKNLLWSLLVAVVVHLVFIFVPLFIFFFANLIVIPHSDPIDFLGFILQEHGVMSTSTMLVTNNLLRRSIISTFSASRCFKKCQGARNTPSAHEASTMAVSTVFR
uniref:Uncharacterized protein n=1 Tax=Caenorhabditis japonica TaxID=281687 RepID=A0A8R1HYN7_CAEJA